MNIRAVAVRLWRAAVSVALAVFWAAFVVALLLHAYAMLSQGGYADVEIPPWPAIIDAGIEEGTPHLASGDHA